MKKTKKNSLSSKTLSFKRARNDDPVSTKISLKKIPNINKLIENQSFLDSIIENIPDMVFVKDAKDLRFVRFNKAGEELLGFDRKDLIGKNDYDFFPEEEAKFFISKDREVLSGGKVVDISEEPIHTKKKGTRYLHTKKIPIIGDDGAPLYLLGISEDITEKQQTQEKLQLYHDVVENTQIVIFMWHLEDLNDSASFRLIAINPMARTVIGPNLDGLIGKTIEECFPWFTGTQYPEKYRQVVLTGKKMDLGDIYVKEKSVAQKDWNVRLFPLPNNCLGVSLENISDRKDMERQILSVIGQEQRRIGQVLHDQLGQDLTAIAFMTKALEKSLADQGSEEVQQLKDINDLVVKSIESTRGLARGLQPVELDTGGLKPALEDLAISTESLFKIKCSFHAEEPFPSVEYDVALQLYRIAQEAVHNAVKHAKAEKIQISLKSVNNRVVLSIQDNGIGIPQEKQMGKKGMGIHLMEYRAHAIEALLEIKNIKEGGTLVQCLLQ